MAHTLDNCAACRDYEPTNRPRVYALTDRAVAAIGAATCLAPCDLFTPDQYDAIRNAGLDVRFVPLASVLEALS